MVEMVEDEMNKIMQLIQNRKTKCTQVPGSSVLVVTFSLKTGLVRVENSA